MPRNLGLALGALGLVAFAFALTELKPLPQGLVVAVILTALAIDRWATHRARPVTFLLVASLASLLGYVLAGSELVALVQRWLFPTSGGVMPIPAVLIGMAIGVGLFALTFFSVIRPAARIDGHRRIGLLAIAMTGLFAAALDALVL